jgi:class 3 adenylate cyclase/tetratricopeptide (TPR) repeat protein
MEGADMQCPKCQFENRESIIFCEECGAKLELECPSCNEKIPIGIKFCGECGHQLIEEKIIKKKSPAIDSERKNVTVLFSDMSGYTSITERLDPEEVKDLMSRIFGEIAQVIAKYEGFIERFIGDAVMAIFGVPKAHEDDPIRAIKAAWEIHLLVEALSPQIEQKVGQKITMHSGINTGLVVTGEVDVQKGTHGITGDPVNIASRLEDLADKGEILVGEQTFRQAEGYFIFERLEPKRLKGKKEVVNAYSVIAAKNARTRFDVNSERGLTPLVGRKQELDLLLVGFNRSKEKRGQAFSIISEAGRGKSRLLYEFRKAVAKENVTFLEGKCLSYAKNIAYQPIIEILKSNFNINDKDKEFEIIEKVKMGLKALSVDQASTLPYVLELLSVKDRGFNNAQISPEEKRNQIVEALKLITVKSSEIRPLVIAIEDLHWMDKSSEDTLIELLAAIPGEKIFLIFTYRPEFLPNWGVKSYINQINLNRLDTQETNAMANNILETEKIDDELLRLLLEKTQGNPFYIEEFIRSFIDLKIIDKRDKYYLSDEIKNIIIPTTIHDVITARVDSLQEQAKEVLQMCSVTGREISSKLLIRLMEIPEEKLRSHLSEIMESELIYERGIFPQSTHVFKHALTRDVVYDSILMKRKKELHEKIGNTIENLYNENIDQFYGVLAEHFIASNNYEKGAAYSKLAGDRAEKTGSLADGINYAIKRVTCMENMPRTKSLEEKIVHLRTILGLYMIEMNFFKEAKEITLPIIELALNSADEKRISQIKTVMGILEFAINENFQNTFEYLEDAFARSKQAKDMLAIATTSFWLGNAQHFNCEFEQAEINIKTAINIVKGAKISWREATINSCLGYFVYYNKGEIDTAYEKTQQAVEMAEESDDIHSKVFAYSCHGIVCFGKGLFKESLKFLSVGRESSRKCDHKWWQPWTNHSMAEVYLEIGKYKEAKEYFLTAASQFDVTGYWQSAAAVNIIGLANAKLLNNEDDIRIENLYKYIKVAKANLYKGRIKRNFSEAILRLNRENISEAKTWIKKAINDDERNGVLFELGRDYLWYAKLFKRERDELSAQENVGRALDIFRKTGAQGWVEKYEGGLAAV